MPNTQADHVVAKFGGQSALSRALGHKHPTTVQRWVESGSIPERHWAAILEAARTVDPVVELTPDDFVAHLKGDPSTLGQPPKQAAV